ncbi:MAG: bifunctional DNA-formamidopyrimidine glycosylase/DNA-(apurinic or apyrimidinic site) lyase [Pseudomonadota bacterium]
MPELPEVETIRSGLAPLIEKQQIKQIIVRNPNLRWPITAELPRILKKQHVYQLMRRSKYLVFKCDNGAVLLHLGMSGRLRWLDKTAKPVVVIGPHDHVDFVFQTGDILRYTDPRRFGSIHWTEDWINHALIQHLGPEPLSPSFTADYLYSIGQKRKSPIKLLIMNAQIVVGVGNIYANEALFQARIKPTTLSNTVSAKQYAKLHKAIQQVLVKAIKAGGTTLKDFKDGHGQAGYFQNSLSVYGQENQPCIKCRTPICREVLGQRATYFCPTCQK